jgi:hypothetical protein
LAGPPERRGRGAGGSCAALKEKGEDRGTIYFPYLKARCMIGLQACMCKATAFVEYQGGLCLHVWNGNEVRPREEDIEEMERTAVEKIFFQMK